MIQRSIHLIITIDPKVKSFPERGYADVFSCRSRTSQQVESWSYMATLSKICRSCGVPNGQDAKDCASCGASLDAELESSSRFLDDDPALRYVDPNNRIELDRFERLDEAELACGLLRYNGIACELSPMPLPGLPADIILWVHNQDAELAWALLADAEREASEKNDDVA